jgi:hypothetical protein
MKMTMIAAITAASLSACASVGITHQESTKAMIVAESGFNAAVHAERQAKAAGVLKGAKAAEADALVAKAYAALKVARISYRAGGTPSTVDIVILTTQIIDLTR